MPMKEMMVGCDDVRVLTHRLTLLRSPGRDSGVLRAMIYDL